MAQYKSGTISITKGSNAVTVTGATADATAVAVGDSFKVDRNGEAIYQIAARTPASGASLTALTLSVNYGGNTGSGLGYQITTDYTPNRNYPELAQGDADAAEWITRALREIDHDLAALVGTGNAPAFGTANQVQGINAAGTAIEWKSIVAGTAISLANAAGLLTVNNTGVTSLTGTANRVTVSGATGAITLSGPQDLHSGASPSFAGLITSGNVGIGTASPASLGDGGTITLLQIHNTAGNGLLEITSPNIATGSTIGGVAFGCTGLSGADKRTGAIYNIKRDAQSVNGTGDMLFYIWNNGVANNVMTLAASGNVYMGTTAQAGSAQFVFAAAAGNNGVYCTVNGTGANAAFYGNVVATNQYLAYFTYQTITTVGTITTNGTTTSYNTTSDYRLKQNVHALVNALGRLRRLRPCAFEFTTDPGTEAEGFLAHELQAIIPAAVTGRKDQIDSAGGPIYQGVDHSKIVPVLVAAVQEIDQRLSMAGL